MKNVFRFGDDEFIRLFDETIVIKDCNEEKAMPTSFRVDFDLPFHNIIGGSTLEMLLYNFFLEVSGFDMVNGKDVFFRIDNMTMQTYFRCGRFALVSAINKLVADDLLYVLKEVGKANAYYVRV